MNEIKIFENAEFGSVRTVETEEGKVLFCGADVAKALGYSNSRDALVRHCKEKGVAKHDTLTNGGVQALTYIDEGNVYRLITHSKLPDAERFESWVFDEVLPSIRKHGMYATDKLLANPDFAIQVFQELKAEREKHSLLETTIKVQNQQIAELQPKASYYDVVLNCKDLVSISVIAKDFGKSAVWLNQYLHDKGVQYKQGGVWLLYQKYAEQGYTSTKTHTVNGNDGLQHSKVHTYWTQKGRLYIYNLLKECGYLPICEKEAIT